MWEERYSGAGDYLFGTAPAAMLTENPWVADGAGTALCVADGEGRNGCWLAGQGLSVTTFDPAPTAVARARSLAAKRGVDLDAHVSDWDGWDWSRRYDLVVGIFIQFADPDFRSRQFADLRRSLAPGGRLLLHGYRPPQVELGTGGPPDPAHMYDDDMLREAFADLRIERLAAYERDVQEGRGHSGRSALIDLIARA